MNPRFSFIRCHYSLIRASTILVLGCAVAPLWAVTAPSSDPKSKPNPKRAAWSIGASSHGLEASTEEKEYAELIAKLRTDDAGFLAELRKANAAEKKKLRSDRSSATEPTLRRINELARSIGKSRSNREAGRETEPVALSTPLTASDEIAGKSEEELARLGVAVHALHQHEPASSTASPKEQSAPRSKK